MFALFASYLNMFGLIYLPDMIRYKYKTKRQNPHLVTNFNIQQTTGSNSLKFTYYANENNYLI
jgi:hypothetical protein